MENIESKEKKIQSSKHNTIIDFMIYTSTTQFNIILERKHEIHLLFTLYKKLSFKSTTILMPFRKKLDTLVSIGKKCLKTTKWGQTNE